MTAGRPRVLRLIVAIMLAVGLVTSMAEMTRCGPLPYTGQQAAMVATTGANSSAPAVPPHTGSLHCCYCIHIFVSLEAGCATGASGLPEHASREPEDIPASVILQPPVRPPSA